MRTRYRKHSLWTIFHARNLELDTPALMRFATTPVSLYDFIDAELSVF